jgi:hypothetical protein
MSKKKYTIRTDALDATFDDAEKAALTAMREIVEGADRLDIEVTRRNGRACCVGYKITPEMLDDAEHLHDAVREFRRAVREFWRGLRPLYHVSR